MPDASAAPVATSQSDAIAALRQRLRDLKLDAFIVPRFDAHQSEYVAPHDERLAFVTGFTGSAGMAIVSQDEIAMFVDGRYSVQVRNECLGPEFTYHHLFDTPAEQWLSAKAQSGWRVGFDPMHLPPAWYDRFNTACIARAAAMEPCQTNPIDEIWDAQPTPPLAEVTPFPTQFAGQNADDKCRTLVQELGAAELDFFVETQPDNIAWLLNVRGDDVAFNPMPQSFAIIEAAGTVHWFVEPRKLTEELCSHLADSVTLHPHDAFLNTLSALSEKETRVGFDPNFSGVAVRHTIEAEGAVACPLASPITHTKAVKNPVELEGMRACHLQDGVAWTEFSAWLMANVAPRASAGAPITEQEAQEKILELRQQRSGFLSASFQSISAARGNAAMCHYAAVGDRNAPILPEHPYLLDSGGQYETGTTDATRSFAFGMRPEGYDQAYTAVFKAFHALATLRFPKGTQGHHIDAICRRPLWDLGLDYDHGTGHGIGHRLSVHEHPQRIGKPYNPVDLVPGMVVSIEPGYYDAEKFGIRIENIFEVKEDGDGFLRFANMTYAPIQTDMLIKENLTFEECVWLEQYHATLLQKLSPLLSEDAMSWMSSVARRSQANRGKLLDLS